MHGRYIAHQSTVYDFLDDWLREYDAAPHTTANRFVQVQIKLLKSMAEYAPVLPPDGTSPRGQEAIVADIMRCYGDKDRLRTLAALYWDGFLVPSESSGGDLGDGCILRDAHSTVKAAGGKTRQPTEHPSRDSDGEHRIESEITLEEAKRDQDRMKRLVSPTPSLPFYWWTLSLRITRLSSGMGTDVC